MGTIHMILAIVIFAPLITCLLRFAPAG